MFEEPTCHTWNVTAWCPDKGSNDETTSHRRAFAHPAGMWTWVRVALLRPLDQIVTMTILRASLQKKMRTKVSLDQTPPECRLMDPLLAEAPKPVR